MAPFLSAVATLAVDQWTKRMVSTRGAAAPLTSPLVSIRFVDRSRSAARSHRELAVLIAVWVAALAAAAVLHISSSWFGTTTAAVALGAAFGGAAGNLLDLVRRGRVVDFIDLGWWPVFNVADIAIVGGLLVAFWPEL